MHRPYEQALCHNPAQRLGSHTGIAYKLYATVRLDTRTESIRFTHKVCRTQVSRRRLNAQAPCPGSMLRLCAQALSRGSVPKLYALRDAQGQRTD